MLKAIKSKLDIKQVFLLFSIFTSMTSTTNAQTIDAQYYLTGVHEMASGFKFEANGSFQFFLSYGAMDRFAKGTYKITKNKIILVGSKIAGKDFSITKQEKLGKGFKVRVISENNYLQEGVLCCFKNGDREDTVYTDKEGVAATSMTDCQTIQVLHTFYPDVVTEIKGPGNESDYFEIALSPSLEEVSFKNFELVMDNDFLKGRLPYLFLQEESIFTKR